ncbi:hypothetical protein [Nannocystis punicea]|uniref:Uncharacterized protein n=1 Tax=Nannocystis punicea TaxID=2995304 RepID=A0ABY7HE27_9BACT|nr:hypothetical protein [Nannocystis poenicansa]WAS97383.1 hypothetical protein O0S08_14645 [Nannocystis poenicansa]
MFLALAWPGRFVIAEFFDVLDPDFVARLEEAGSEQFTVFHDVLGDFAAFDARLRDASGEPRVVEGFDDRTWIELVLRPQASTKRFEAWLEQRIARIKLELG